MALASLSRAARQVAAAAMVMLAAALTGVTQAQPRIAVRDTMLQFGTMFTQEDQVRTTRVFNRGNAPLHIDHITTPCQCSRPSIDTRIIAPGDSATLSIIFNGKSYDGEVEKYVLLVTNDPARRNCFVRFRAHVSPPVKIASSAVVFHSRGSAAPDTAYLAIQNQWTSPIRITAIGDSTGRVSSIMTKVLLEAGEVRSVPVIYTPQVGDSGAETRRFGTIQVRTDCPLTPVVERPFFVR